MSKTVFDYEELAKRKKVAFVGEYPRTTRHKTSWKCSSCKLVWETTYHILDWSRVGCPSCARKSVVERHRITREDYLELSRSRKDIGWVGGQKIPWRIHDKSSWKCSSCKYSWETTYNNVKYGHVKCPKCGQFISGQRASKAQVKLGNDLGGVVNYRVGRLSLDIAFPKKNKAIELDVWYWHAHKSHLDKQRAQKLVNMGWHILAIKTQNTLPSLEEIQSTLDTLVGYQEIVTSEWGRGKTFKNL